MSRPTPSDIARATEFVDRDLAAKCDAAWIAAHRDQAIRQASKLAMLERQQSVEVALEERGLAA